MEENDFVKLMVRANKHIVADDGLFPQVNSDGRRCARLICPEQVQAVLRAMNEQYGTIYKRTKRPSPFDYEEV